jgi:hypothetical protein
MYEHVNRPKAAKGKISSKEEFELCYLRHQYLRRSEINPDAQAMKPYAKIIRYISQNTYYTYQFLLSAVGFELDDIVNVNMTHLVSFLGLFAIEQMPDKFDEFIIIHRKKHGKNPTQLDILNKNKANFTLFLKQRMEDMVRICRQKARNVKGHLTEEFNVYYGPKKPPKILRTLLKSHEKLGFRKLDIAVFKSIRKKAKCPNERLFKFGRNWYVCVPIEQKSLGLVDFTGADMDPYDNIHNMDPEQIYFDKRDQQYWEEKKEEFNSFTPERKVRKIKAFIRKYKDDPAYKEEVRTARKLLKSEL